MQKIQPLLLTLPALLLAHPAPAVAQVRGETVSAEVVISLTAEEVSELVAELAGDAIPPFLLNIFLPSRFDIMGVRVVYHTINGLGQPTIASGLVVTPVNAPAPAAMLTYHHGTFADDASAPSNLGREAPLGYIAAMDVSVAVLPDYLGFGASPDLHPYIHADTEASASIDWMRAGPAGGRGGRPGIERPGVPDGVLAGRRGLRRNPARHSERGAG
jgi:hypothetical protein